jgi:hypothetical protein
VIEPLVEYQLAYSISKMGEARCVTSRVTVNVAYYVQNLTASPTPQRLLSLRTKYVQLLVACAHFY